MRNSTNDVRPACAASAAPHVHGERVIPEILGDVVCGGFLGSPDRHAATPEEVEGLLRRQDAKTHGRFFMADVRVLAAARRD